MSPPELGVGPKAAGTLEASGPQGAACGLPGAEGPVGPPRGLSRDLTSHESHSPGAADKVVTEKGPLSSADQVFFQVPSPADSVACQTDRE